MAINVQADLKQAQLSRDELKVSTLRLLLSEIKNAEIVLRQSSGQAKLGELSEQDIISIVQREVKKRKEAAAGFRQGNREELAQKEESEAKILEAYLPLQVTDEELTAVVLQSIKEVGASSVSDMGKVMGVVMGKVKGQADGTRVSSIVKERLS